MVVNVDVGRSCKGEVRRSNMADIYTYIKPELLVLIPTLYIIGLMIKNSELISNKYIPAIIGMCGIALAFIYVTANEGFTGIGIFTAIVQGVLCAGVATYADQLIKQNKKED